MKKQPKEPKRHFEVVAAGIGVSDLCGHKHRELHHVERCEESFAKKYPTRKTRIIRVWD